MHCSIMLIGSTVFQNMYNIEINLHQCEWIYLKEEKFWQGENKKSHITFMRSNIYMQYE